MGRSKMKNTQLLFTDRDVLQMIDDTSKLLSKKNSSKISNAVVAAKSSNALTDGVEFWKWMDRNYQKSGIFSSSELMKNHFSQKVGMNSTIQGKGYEWDWMTAQRNNPLNLFKTYNAGDVANRAASDVTEKNLITGKTLEYQLKTNISKQTPDLHNTPKDMIVVTHSEKVSAVKADGYDNVQVFQDTETIVKAKNKRLQQLKEGSATSSYNVKNVAGMMTKAGLIGCAIGIGTESIASYQSWKAGYITDDEYINEILKAGGDSGVTAGATAGIMVPVSAAITAAGASAVITIPIAFVVSSTINKVVSPCFGRGDYKKYLQKAKYYQQLDLCYNDFIASIETSAQSFSDYIDEISVQNQQYDALKKIDKAIDAKLKKLYDEI